MTIAERERQLDKLLAGCGPHIIDVLLAGQGAGAFAQVRNLIGKENAHRLDPPNLDGEVSLDDDNAETLIAKAAHHSRSFRPIFEETFSDHYRQPYTPLYGPKAEVIV